MAKSEASGAYSTGAYKKKRVAALGIKYSATESYDAKETMPLTS